MKEESISVPPSKSGAALNRVTTDDLRTKMERTFPNRCLVSLFILLIALPSLARPQASSPSQSANGDQYTIRENVDFVVLHPTVKDRRGSLVSGLSKDDFQIYEDGVLQQIKYFSHEDIPVTVGLVVDNSGSMSRKRPEVIAAALAFARSSNPEDQMFVITFNEHVSFGLPDDTPFTDKTDHLEIALSRIAADGMTALYDALAAGFEHLKKSNRDKRVLIVVSDGADNASKHKLAQIMTLTGHSDAIIYTVGVFDEEDPDRNPGMLRQLARATGGEAFLPKSLQDVGPICQQIASDIRNQYTVAYAPTNRKQDGTYRVIQVKAAVPGRERLTVHARAGYYAPMTPPPMPAARAIDHGTQK
jgi:Ca-activated chloride channel family protein